MNSAVLFLQGVSYPSSLPASPITKTPAGLPPSLINLSTRSHTPATRHYSTCWHSTCPPGSREHIPLNLFLSPSCSSPARPQANSLGHSEMNSPKTGDPSSAEATSSAGGGVGPEEPQTPVGAANDSGEDDEHGGRDEDMKDSGVKDPEARGGKTKKDTSKKDTLAATSAR
eukprot:1357529-Rhodomonas_salina.1